MIILLSPAKKMDFETKVNFPLGKPTFIDKATLVNQKMKEFSPKNIAELQHLSENLANLNFERNQAWLNQENELTKPALMAFKGDVYVGLAAHTLLEEDLDFAQQNLRILSGLYGWLKPFDGILPYRLEMGTKLPVQEAKNLYEFWKPALTEQLIKDVNTSETNFILNLASNEYAKAINWKYLAKNYPQIQVIEPIFKDWKNGKYKIISFFAKKARGLMARFVIDNRIMTIEQLKDFNYDGYTWNEAMSEAETTLVFTRKEH